jgi:hypothetical protein
VAEPLALPVLLSRVLGGVTRDLQQTLEPAGAVSSLAVWSNVLRCVHDGGSERDLPTEARISRRLAVAAVTGATRRGWLAAAPGARGRDLRLTDAGRTSVAAWQERLSALDEQWADTPLRHRLESLVGQLSVERHGIAVVTWDPAKPTRKLVQLTTRGENIRLSHDRVVSECEVAWRARFGDDVIAGLRRALAAHPSASDATLPDHVVAPLHHG